MSIKTACWFIRGGRFNHYHVLIPLHGNCMPTAAAPPYLIGTSSTPGLGSWELHYHCAFGAVCVACSSCIGCQAASPSASQALDSLQQPTGPPTCKQLQQGRAVYASCAHFIHCVYTPPLQGVLLIHRRDPTKKAHVAVHTSTHFHIPAITRSTTRLSTCNKNAASAVSGRLTCSTAQSQHSCSHAAHG